MSIDHLEFMKTAEQLSTSMAEADLRTAVSRAYYSVLHGVLAALPLDRRPGSSFNGSNHEAIIAEARGYANAMPPLPGRNAAVRVADKMGRLKRKRRAADYQLDCDIDSNYTKQALAEAKAALLDCTDWVSRQKTTKASA